LEIQTQQPQTAILSFAVSVVAYNVLSVLKRSVACGSAQVVAERLLALA
jgi:hypothetical protein